MVLPNSNAWRLFGLMLAALAWPNPGLAHGDLHGQIEELTKQLTKQPKNAELYLRRGELHRAHRDWDAAQADYDRSLTLAPQYRAVHLARGRMFLEADWPLSAKVALSRFLEFEPKHSGALAFRARARVKLREYLAAADDFTASIGSSPEPVPELYIERAQALTEAGEDHFGTALAGLEEGVRKLGPIVTLQLYAIDLEVKLKRIDAALARLDQLAAQSPRQETWLARRGEILRQAGRTAEAQRAFVAALEAIAKLPAARREVPAMVELEKRLRDALQELAEAPPKKSTQAP